MARRLTIMKFKGDPDQLLAVKREKLDPVTMGKAREYGGISHSVAKTPDGITIVNTWESGEGSDRMRQDPDVVAAIESAGIGPPEVEHYELVQHETA